MVGANSPVSVNLECKLPDLTIKYMKKRTNWNHLFCYETKLTNNQVLEKVGFLDLSIFVHMFKKSSEIFQDATGSIINYHDSKIRRQLLIYSWSAFVTYVMSKRETFPIQSPVKTKIRFSNSWNFQTQFGFANFKNLHHNLHFQLETRFKVPSIFLFSFYIDSVFNLETKRLEALRPSDLSSSK